MAAGRKRRTPFSLSLSLTLFLCFSLVLSLLFSPRRTEEKIVRKYADTKHGEPIRARFARQKRFPRSLGFDRDPRCTSTHLYGENAPVLARVCTYIFQRQFSRVFGKFLDQSRCSLFPLCFTRSRLCSSRMSSFLLLLSFFLSFFLPHSVLFLFHERDSIF